MKLKKYISQKEMNKIAKTALAMVLAGSFTFSSSKAFANETTTENNNVLSVEAPTESTIINNTVAATNDVTANPNSESEVKVEEPALVPGDFFYFAKLTIEKIKLILTTNDVKEAELLAKFASERLAEAESLFAQGNEKLALETIEKAVESMNVADSVVLEQKETTSISADNHIEVTNGDRVEVTTDDKAKEETTEDRANEEVNTSIDVPKVEAPTNDEDAVQDIEKILSHNIIALTAAMEKVQNPVAKAALQKNIEKSYAKLEKKLAKIEVRLAKEAEEAKGFEENDQELSNEEIKVEAALEAEADKAVTTSENEKTVLKVEEETKTNVQSVKAVKAEDKKAIKAVKEEVKKEIKAKREQAKREMKETKNSLKELHGKKDRNDRQHKHEGKERKGNGKGHN